MVATSSPGDSYSVRCKLKIDLAEQLFESRNSAVVEKLENQQPLRCRSCIVKLNFKLSPSFQRWAEHRMRERAVRDLTSSISMATLYNFPFFTSNSDLPNGAQFVDVLDMRTQL